VTVVIRAIGALVFIRARLRSGPTELITGGTAPAVCVPMATALRTRRARPIGAAALVRNTPRLTPVSVLPGPTGPAGLTHIGVTRIGISLARGTSASPGDGLKVATDITEKLPAATVAALAGEVDELARPHIQGLIIF
jgi:hypothetical protein